MAHKMAGRLNFAVSVSVGKVGRAFIKPLFQQAFAPLPRERASPNLVAACSWWIEFIEADPQFLVVGRQEDPRWEQDSLAVESAVDDIIMPRQVTPASLHHRRVNAWTDAAGATRWLAAVIRADDKWFNTRVQVPSHVWAQFLPREDEQIGMQELLAIPLLLCTFQHEGQFVVAGGG